MSTPKTIQDKPTSEMPLALSDLVAGLHEYQLGSRWALVGEAVEDFEIRRGQVLVVTTYDGEVGDDLDDEPELVFVAGPEGIRLAARAARPNNVQPCGYLL